MPKLKYRTLEDRFETKERVEKTLEKIKQQVDTNTFKRLAIRVGWQISEGYTKYQYFPFFDSFYSFLQALRYQGVWEDLAEDDPEGLNEIETVIIEQQTDARGRPREKIIWTFK